MKFTPKNPPRAFRVGENNSIELKDCGAVELSPDEQVTFVTPSKTEYDVVRKSWGYYATPSLDSRLPQFGLRSAIVKSAGDRHYILLVEKDKVGEFKKYLAVQCLELVDWLDHGDPKCLCGHSLFESRHLYTEPPAKETRFNFKGAAEYRREIIQCRHCQHYLSVHQMNLAGFYEGDYVKATYGDHKLKETFDRIIGLPAGKSDNQGRVEYIQNFAATYFKSRPPASVLDVGSGTCVFLHEMKKAGWDCTALDPDSQAARHAREIVGVQVIQGDFMSTQIDQKFDLVTFNKVLEHVVDPISMLQKSLACVKPGGLVYIEVPDGQMAALDREEFGREEFFIEHLHVFSDESLTILIQKGGFHVLRLERLQEPSTKYTLRALIAPALSRNEK